MRFEVHVEDVPAGFDKVRDAVQGAVQGQVPDGMVEHVAKAVAEIAAPMTPDNHTIRVAVSGKLADSWPNDDREADAVHVSVYLGPKIEVEEGGAASGQVIQVSDAKDDPGDVSLHGQGRAVDRTSVDFDEIRATADALRSSSADNYPGGPQKYGDDQTRVLRAMNENPDEFRE